MGFADQLTSDKLTKISNMKFLVVVSCMLAVAFAKPGGVVAPVAYSVGVPNGFSYSYSSQYTAPVAHVAYSAPVAHSAYAVAPTAYSSVAVAPAAYSNVAVAPAAYSSVAIAPVAHSSVAVAPVTTHSAVVAAPVAHTVVAPVGLEKTQYHAQDELGQAAYGHAEAFQTHNAIQDAAGNKIGSYSYIAPNGQVFATKYVADALGYRVASNAVPVGPAAPQADTVEVVAARQAHLEEHEKVKSRSKRGAVFPAYPYASPVFYNAPYVASTAAVSHVVNVPHPVTYRVY